MAIDGRIIVAGGGPVGLIAGLVLARAGVDVTLFDIGDILHQHPRAATIHPATLDILDDLGVYQRIEPLGIVCPVVNYYDQQELLASFDHGILAAETRHPWVLQCEQDKLSRVLFDMAKDVPKLEIRTETEVVDCAQSADAVDVEVRSPQGKHERIRGRYLIGADGARSTVRRCIGVEFGGFTYGERFMIIGTPYDFSQAGYAYRNYISDPVEWYNLFKIAWNGPPGVYRLVVPLKLNEVLDDDRMLETCQRKFQRFHPRSRTVRDRHLRFLCCAPARCRHVPPRPRHSRRGRRPSEQPDRRDGDEQRHPRCREPGDQHVAGPSREENEGALDRYVRQRRHVAVEHVQSATIANKKNMEQGDPETRRKYREEMKRASEDPVLAKKFLMRTSLIESLRDAAMIR